MQFDRRAICCVLATTSIAFTSGRSSAATCEDLGALKLPNMIVTAAQVVPAGTFVPPAPPVVNRAGAAPAGGRGGGGNPAALAAYKRLPDFCRVEATLTPSNDSDIRIEVWLPSSGWNGKFQAVGNGGWAGSISYPALAAAVAGGYASASTDTGHRGNSAQFALGHPEKIVDIGYRAVHEMTVHAKGIINAMYAAPPKLSFWNGCSLGGRQGLTEAMRYPADFDGILAGAPAVDWMHLHSGRIAMNLAINKTPAHRIPEDKYPLIHQAVLAACDSRDGIEDGVIENPERCTFDPKTIQCSGTAAASCLTPAQVEAARTFYAPVTHPGTKATIVAGLVPGAELDWNTLGGNEPQGNALEAFKYVVFKDPNWDWRTFNPATDFDLADKLDGGTLASADPNLKPFFDRGGKLIMYHGWSDPQVTPLNTVNYFKKVVDTVGKPAVGTSLQLYMVPGMLHCQGGPGTDTFDKMAAIESFVATGRAPAQMVASHVTAGKVDRTRPLCPYGQVAKWKGTGSTDDAANFSCVAESAAGTTRP